MLKEFNIIASRDRKATLTINFSPAETSENANGKFEGYTIKTLLSAGTASEKNPDGNAARQVYSVMGTDIEAMLMLAIRAVVIPVSEFCNAVDQDVLIEPSQLTEQIKFGTGITTAELPTDDSGRMKPNPAVVDAEKKKPTATELSQLNHEAFINNITAVIEQGQYDIAKKSLEEYILTAKGDKKKEANTLLVAVANKIKFQETEVEPRQAEDTDDILPAEDDVMAEPKDTVVAQSGNPNDDDPF